MRPTLESYIQNCIETYPIDVLKQKTLTTIAENLWMEYNTTKSLNLLFVCTHNSRRSHLSQIWAKTAANYYSFPAIQSFSGGTKTTAFYPSAVQAIENAGFKVRIKEKKENPVYEVSFDPQCQPLEIYSKPYATPENPKSGFIAIVNCSNADESCPIIEGAQQRYKMLFQDPKAFDGSAREQQKYDERCLQIAAHFLFLFKTMHALNENNPQAVEAS